MCTNLFTVPTGGPFELKAFNVTAHELTLQWLPPSECLRNGNITHYHLNCSFSNATHPYINQTIDARIESIIHTINDLNPFTNYTCSLAAGTGIGIGPATSLNITTLESSMNM